MEIHPVFGLEVSSVGDSGYSMTLNKKFDIFETVIACTIVIIVIHGVVKVVLVCEST